jgi:hypothetical protein
LPRRFGFGQGVYLGLGSDFRSFTLEPINSLSWDAVSCLRQFEQRLSAESKMRSVIVLEHGLTTASRDQGRKILSLKRLLAGGTCFVGRATKPRIADFAALSFRNGMSPACSVAAAAWSWWGNVAPQLRNS